MGKDRRGDRSMGIVYEEEIRKKALMDTAEKMLIAARTAPKGKGVDNLVISIADREVIEKIAAKMKEMALQEKVPEFFIRDADNILTTDVLVLIGTKIKSMGIKYCGLCGFPNCEEKNKHPEHPCIFNSGDLGIAVGSAVSVAMDARVDNRIMYSVGIVVRDMGLMGADVKIIYGIPLSSGPKNPFFDRKFPTRVK
jgi:uncharacterized ferredoxin-like protein